MAIELVVRAADGSLRRVEVEPGDVVTLAAGETIEAIEGADPSTIEIEFTPEGLRIAWADGSASVPGYENPAAGDEVSGAPDDARQSRIA